MHNDEPGNLHNSDAWGKPHVDIGKDHGHSPTIIQPRQLDGVTELGQKRDDPTGNLPAPFGPFLKYP